MAIRYAHHHAAIEGMNFDVDKATSDYLREQNQRYYQTIGVERASRLQERFTRRDTAEHRRVVREIRAASVSVWDDFIYKALESVEDVRNAPAVMQPYIMAHPRLRAMYNNGSINGYDEYIDSNPKRSGVELYEYRQVTNGRVINHNGKSGFVNYSEVHLENKKLSTADVDAVIKTWQFIDNNIASGDSSDPTSRWGGIL